ncbi:MAG: hypothetical protein ABLT11_00245, partial [Candidatus Acidiferrum sp.]
LRFQDGATMKEVGRGKGDIFWAAYPVELAEGTAPATEVYNYVLGRVGIAPAFTLAAPLPAGVLIYATVLQDAVLYVMASDSADDVSIDLRDGETGARLNVALPSQHAAMALIGLLDKTVIAKYGF